MTWGVTLDQIEKKKNGDKAVEVLNILAYCASENIPTEMFFRLVTDDGRLGSVIELLKQYSMIDLNQRTLSIHRLVQQVTRTKLREKNEEKDVLRKGLKIFTKNSMSPTFLYHAMSIWNYSSKYTELLYGFAYVSTYISSQLLDCAKFEEAFLFGMKVLELFNSLSSNDPNILLGILTTNNNVAMALSEQGKYDMALTITQQLYKDQETLFGPNHPDTLLVKSNMALTLNRQGKYNEALRCYQEVLDVSKTVLGENHPDTLSTKHDLAVVLLNQGKYDQASVMLKEVSKADESASNRNCHQILETKNYLTIAGALANKGNYNEALQMFEETCDIQESTLGKNHPIVLNTKHNIAGMLHKQEKFSEALHMYKEVLDAKKAALGDTHPDVFSTYHNIAEILQEQGKYDEALRMCQETLQKKKDTLGCDHPGVLSTQFMEARILDAQGKHNNALRVYQEVLSKKKVVLGNDHPDTLKVSNSIAVLFSKQGKYHEALQYNQEVLKLQKENLGENHPDTLVTSSNIGMLLCCTKEYEKALKILQKTFNTLQALMPGHPDTLRVKSNIALVLVSQKKHSEALKTFREVLDFQEAILGKEDLNATINTKNNIASVLLEMGEHNQALRVLRDVFKGLTISLGPKHPETMRINDNIKSLTTAANDLITAVRKNNLKMLENLVKKGLDVNTKDDDNITLLHYAVNNGNIGIVNILLKNGAKITEVTQKGNTLLHIACSKCQKDIVEILLQCAKQLVPLKFNDFINSKTTAKNTTALHIAAQKGNLNIVKLLLQSGAVYNIKNKEDRTPSQFTVDEKIKVLFDAVDKLFEDVKKGNKKEVADVLKEEKAIINARDANGGTILFWAVQNSLIGTANVLLENGADPSLVTNKGNTPLHMASSKGNNDIADMLLEAVKREDPKRLNTFVNAQTTAGETTALHVASNVEVVKSLLQCGASYNIKNKEGKTPLDSAKNDAIRNLLNITDDLFNGAKNGDPKIIGNLLSLGDVHDIVKSVCNDQGHTLLEIARLNGHEDVASKLSKVLVGPG